MMSRAADKFDERRGVENAHAPMRFTFQSKETTVLRSLLVFLCAMLWFTVNTMTAQPRLDGVLGIPFGSSMETVKKLMLSKPGAKLVKKYDASQDKNSSWPFYYFTGLTMGNYALDTCILSGNLTKRVNGASKFKMARLPFKRSSSADYFAVLEMLEQEFGKPDRSTDDEIGGTVHFWNFTVDSSNVKNSLALEYFGPSFAHESLTVIYRGDGSIMHLQSGHQGRSTKG